jgi:hypothetical protein
MEDTIVRYLKKEELSLHALAVGNQSVTVAYCSLMSLTVWVLELGRRGTLLMTQPLRPNLIGRNMATNGMGISSLKVTLEDEL